MVKEGNEGATWPMPKFRFEVDLGSGLTNVAFQEVSGIETENKIIKYPNSELFSAEPKPGIEKYGNVTMKRGVFVNDDTFWNWRNEINMNTIKRRTVLIKLLNEKGAVTMQWQLVNAWPVKITGPNLKSDGNEVAIDTLEIAHEQLIVTNG